MSTWFRRVVVTFAAVVVLGITAFAIHSYVALEPRSSFMPGQITRISSASSCVYVIGASVEVCSDQVNAGLKRAGKEGTDGSAAKGDCVIVEINERDPYEVRDVWLNDDVGPGC